MRQIVDFITDNLSFLIFLFVLAAPVLGKVFKSMGQPGENRPAGRMPSFGGDRSDQDLERKEMERKAAIRAAQRQYEEQQRKQAGSGEGITLEGYGQPSRTSQSALDAARPGRMSGLPVSKSNSAGSTSENDGFHLEEDDLVRGVVWSEILGPPRAKRPYRR